MCSSDLMCQPAGSGQPGPVDDHFCGAFERGVERRCSFASYLVLPPRGTRCELHESMEGRYNGAVQSQQRRERFVVQVCLSAAERDRLAILAVDCGLPLSGYCRRILMGQRLPRRDARPVPHINQETWTLLVEIQAALARLSDGLEESGASYDWRRKVAEGLSAFAEGLGRIQRAVLGIDGRSIGPGDSPGT